MRHLFSYGPDQDPEESPETGWRDDFRVGQVPSNVDDWKRCSTEDTTLSTSQDAGNIYFMTSMKPQTPTVGQWPPITKPLRERSGLVGIGVFDLEHVAGRGCQNTNGYNGNNISLEEMRGCQTVQILLPKEKDWQAWPDGLKVEATSNFYLTGIAHCQGLILNERLGRVDLDHLMALYNVEKYSPVDGESDPDLLSALNKSWIHHPGDEWLTANPFYVPQLRDLLERAMNTDPFSLYMHHGTMNHEIKPDRFSCFPNGNKTPNSGEPQRQRNCNATAGIKSLPPTPSLHLVPTCSEGYAMAVGSLE